jgi:hypothetical protein
MTTPRDLLARLAGYVPFHALIAVLEQPDREFQPLERREGAVLRLELQGLAPLTEALSVKGRPGAEELGQLLSHLLSELLEQGLFPADGFLLRFGGETLTAFFDGPGASLRAGWAARTMVERTRAFSAVQTAAGVRTLKARVGVATGPISLVYLGAGHDRVACVPGGATVQRALECAAHAPWGAAVLDEATFAAAPGLTRGSPQRGGAQVDAATEIQKAPVRDVRGLIAAAPQASLEKLLPLVPEALAVAFENKAEIVPELRKATVVVARLASVDWDSARAPADARAAGEVFRNAVLAIRRAGGRVGPVEPSPDGQRLTAIFSAPGARGDAERAAHCALELKGLGLAVALESGATFVGEVGSGLKRELAVAGEASDLGARLLTLARLGDVIVGPMVRSQLWGFGIEALPRIALEDKGSAAAPGLLLAAPEPQTLKARPRTSEAAPSGLVGHEREFLRLRERGLQVRQTRREGMVLLQGPVGIGKSALLDAYGTEWSAQGGSAVFARLTEADGQRPWALAGRLMRQLLRLPSDTDPGKAPDAVSRLDRRLSPVAPYAAVLLGAPGPATHEAVVELLRGILAHRASDAPLLVGIDNAHHADASSAQAWAQVTAELTDQPLFWVVAQAGGEGLPAFEALGPEVVEVGPIDQSLAVSLLLKWVPQLTSPQALQCAEAGRGNPFLMLSAARWVLAKGAVPASGDLLGVWTLGLEEDPRTLAELVSVFAGARASVEVLYEALKEFDRRANGRDAIAALEKRELLERRLGKLRFRSRAVQEAIYARLPEDRKKLLHGSVGRALKLCEPESPAALFAFHFSRSDSLPEAVRSGMRAGEEALKAGALLEASEFFGRAARAAEQCRAPEVADALARQVRAQVRLGRLPEVRALAEKAIAAARATGRNRALAEALASLAHAAHAQDELEPALAAAREAAEVVTWAKDADLAAEIFGLAAQVEASANHPRAAAKWARQALRSARAQGSPTLLARARAALGAAALSGGHLRGAARELAEAQRLFSIAGEPARGAEAAASRAQALAGAGRADAALGAVREALEVAEAPGAARAQALLAQAWAQLDLKKPREAEAALGQARALAGKRLRALVELYELVARAMRGASGAVEALEALIESAEPWVQAHGHYGAARAAQERGDSMQTVMSLAKAELLAREHARGLLPAIARLKSRAMTSKMAQA